MKLQHENRINVNVIESCWASCNLKLLKNRPSYLLCVSFDKHVTAQLVQFLISKNRNRQDNKKRIIASFSNIYSIKYWSYYTPHGNLLKFIFLKMICDVFNSSLLIKNLDVRCLVSTVCISSAYLTWITWVIFCWRFSFYNNWKFSRTLKRFFNFNFRIKIQIHKIR